jgi:hypothetical protein
MKLRNKVGAVLIAAGLILAAGSAVAAAKAPTTSHKVWVCKYVGKPGVNERLKEGKNPISVDSDATVGTYFNDAQGRSFVLAEDVGQPAPGVSACPAPDVPTPDPTPSETSSSATPTETESSTPTHTVSPTPSESSSSATPSETTTAPTTSDPTTSSSTVTVTPSPSSASPSVSPQPVKHVVFRLHRATTKFSPKNSPVAPKAQLAHTGAAPWLTLFAGVALVAAGLTVLAFLRGAGMKR